MNANGDRIAQRSGHRSFVTGFDTAPETRSTGIDHLVIAHTDGTIASAQSATGSAFCAQIHTQRFTDGLAVDIRFAPLAGDHIAGQRTVAIRITRITLRERYVKTSGDLALGILLLQGQSTLIG